MPPLKPVWVLSKVVLEDVLAYVRMASWRVMSEAVGVFVGFEE